MRIDTPTVWPGVDKSCQERQEARTGRQTERQLPRNGPASRPFNATCSGGRQHATAQQSKLQLCPAISRAISKTMSLASCTTHYTVYKIQRRYTVNRKQEYGLMLNLHVVFTLELQSGNKTRA